MQIDLTVRHLLYSILMGPGDYKDIGPRNTAFLLVVFGGLVLFAVWDKIAEAARRYCTLRVRNEIRIDVVVVENDGRILGKCMEEEP